MTNEYTHENGYEVAFRNRIKNESFESIAKTFGTHRSTVHGWMKRVFREVLETPDFIEIVEEASDLEFHEFATEMSVDTDDLRDFMDHGGHCPYDPEQAIRFIDEWDCNFADLLAEMPTEVAAKLDPDIPQPPMPKTAKALRAEVEAAGKDDAGKDKTAENDDPPATGEMNGTPDDVNFIETEDGADIPMRKKEYTFEDGYAKGLAMAELRHAISDANDMVALRAKELAMARAALQSVKEEKDTLQKEIDDILEGA